MIVSINQPAYLPWLGYFHRIAASDKHIVLDHVQFEKNSFTNRNKIRTGNGWSWLTVPVKTKGRFGDLAINALEIDRTSDWQAKHWKTLLQSYGKTPYWKNHREYLEGVYQKPWTHVAELCNDITAYFLKALGIQTPISFSSEMHPQRFKDELVLDLCRQSGADAYYSGTLGRNYLREELFKEAGIRVCYQDYHHPEYRQIHGPRFEPFMGIVDLLVNCGPESLEILMSGQEALV